MKTSFAVLWAACILAVGCSSSSDQFDPPDSDISDADVCDARFDEPLQRWESGGFSGSVALSGANVNCFSGYGLADDAGRVNTANTQFSIGSVSKTLTAVSALALMEDGVLTLDEPIGSRIVELSGDSASITVAQLMTHTSGLPQSHANDYEPVSQAEALRSIEGLDLLFSPGSDYAYSNTGYTLLAILVERAAGVSFRDYLVEEVLTLPDGQLIGGFWDGEPALTAPRAIGYFDDGSTGEPGDFIGPYWATEGSGGMAFTARGLHDWLRALVNGDILAPETFELMTTPRVDLGDGQSEAYGWVRFDDLGDGSAAFGIAGGGGSVGHEVIMAWRPEADQILVVASNRSRPIASQLATPILQALVAGDVLDAPPEGIVLEPQQLQSLAGQYVFNDQSVIDVEVDASTLLLSALGTTAVRALYPLPEGFPNEDVSRHEQFALDFLAGSTPEARAELEAIAQEFGEISSSELAGTGFISGELRTYVSFETGAGEQLGWIAFDEFGGVSAAEFPTDPPERNFVAISATEFAAGDLPSEQNFLVNINVETGALRVEVDGAEAVALRDVSG